MEEVQFLGYLVLAIITLGGFVAVIQKFTEPINELKLVIQELRDCIGFIKQDTAAQKQHLEQHDRAIGDLKLHVERIETKIDMYHRDT